MKALFLFLGVFALAPSLFGQDTLWVYKAGKEKYIAHEISSGENVQILSRRFHVPLAKLCDANGVNFQTGLATGSRFKIPVDKYNYYQINSVVKSRPIYYKTQDGDRLRQISRLFHVPQSRIQTWNDLPNPQIEAGQVLQVGWVYFDATQVPFPEALEKKEMLTSKKELDKSQKRQTKIVDTLWIRDSTGKRLRAMTPYEQTFLRQNEGKTLKSGKGAAVFYPLKMQVGTGRYYAFFDDLPKGAIIKVTNPASGISIYAKVIGPLPKISEYHNAIIGISGNAAVVLAAKGKRMFCRVEYP